MTRYLITTVCVLSIDDFIEGEFPRFKEFSDDLDNPFNLNQPKLTLFNAPIPYKIAFIIWLLGTINQFYSEPGSGRGWFSRTQGEQASRD